MRPEEWCSTSLEIHRIRWFQSNIVDLLDCMNIRLINSNQNDVVVVFTTLKAKLRSRK